MDSGRCRSCGRAFTAGEITGRGILRTRPAHKGGPVIEFGCPSCGTVIPLVPFGNGRYALPGQPPPPPPTEFERRMPWDVPGADGEGTGGERKPPEPASENPPTSPPPPKARPPGPTVGETGGRASERPSGAGPARAAAPVPDRRLTVLEAFALLGLSPTAHLADVEKAYREHALLCHPDKVAHLDGEFIDLANRKFRRLQEARDLLVRIADKSPDRDTGRNGEPAR